jgi:hypothetical protein
MTPVLGAPPDIVLFAFTFGDNCAQSICLTYGAWPFIYRSPRASALG